MTFDEWWDATFHQAPKWTYTYGYVRQAWDAACAEWRKRIEEVKTEVRDADITVLRRDQICDWLDECQPLIR